jgi:hypothetical protein
LRFRDDELGPVDPSVQDEVDELFSAVVAATGHGRHSRRFGKAGSKGAGMKADEAKTTSASR